MKHITFKSLFLAFLVIAMSGNAAHAQQIKTQNRAQYVDKTVIFRVKPQFRNVCSATGINDEALQSVFSSLGVTSVKKIYPRHQPPASEYNQYRQPLVDLSLIYEITYTANVTVASAAFKINQTGKVLYADPHFIYALNYTPNDPQISNQNHLNKINAYLGWDVEKGDTNVVIGIIDSGTDPNHPDLAGNLKYNYADPVNGIDDDGDGYTDNFAGWDISMNDNDATVDLTDHGSHVTGCASATTDNGVGVAGSGFKCKFLPVKAEKATSINVIENGYEAIVYAADHGCNVINCSWGGPGGSQYGQDVINYAVYNKNVTMIVSAGNNSNEIEQYPAAYDNVFAIGATNNSDTKASFSTYGWFVDMCAPGVNILSTLYDDTYASFGWSGTSMSAPIAAGCAGIIKSHFPSYNSLQVGELLRVTSDDIYGVNPAYLNKLGKGRINMYNALTTTTPAVRFINRETHDLNDDAFVIGDTLRITGYFKNFLSPTTNLTATLSSTSSAVTILNSTINLGVINTLDSVNNFANPFTVKINPTAGPNVKVLFKLTYNDGTYSDFEIFYESVNVDYINVAINQVSTSITSKGRIGFNNDGQADGLGFQYNGNQLMYDGGLMIGKDMNTVSDVIRGTGTSNDADFFSMQNVYEYGPLKSDMDLTGKFNDNPAATPMNLLVTHRSYAWINSPDDKYVIVEYSIKNNGLNSLTNLYAGTCFDWDIMTYSLNKASVDNNLKMGYAFSTEVNGLYAGVKLLTSGPFVHYAIDNLTAPPGGSIDIVNGGFDSNEKYIALSTNRTDAGGTGTGNDVLDVVSTGPFNIAAGDSVIVAFAIIAGDELTDISQSAANAQIKYNSITGVGNIEVNPYEIKVSPNPASSFVQLNFNTAKSEKLSISVYNAMGEKVINLNTKQYAAGNHSIDIDIAKLPSSVYFLKIEGLKGASVSRFTVLN